MNFQLQLDKFTDIYSTHRHYKIINVTNYHLHCDKRGSRHDFELGVYVSLLDNRHEPNLKMIPNCKCLLADYQLELYNSLAKSKDNPNLF